MEVKINHEFAARMAVILDIFNGNISEVARQAGIKPPSAKRWIEGTSDPQMSNLIQLARAAGVSVAWLAAGEGSPFPADKSKHGADKLTNDMEITDTLGNPIDVAEDFVFIPHYDVYASAGHGYGVEHEKPLFPLAFRRYWLQTYVSNRFEQLSVIVVRGDSMDGVLNDGDTILVNHTDTSPKDDIYVIRIDSDIFVKRIQRLPNKLLVISENDNYETFTIDLTLEQQNFAILGRVVWLGRML